LLIKVLFGALLPIVIAASDASQHFETIKDSATAQQLYTLLYALPKGGDIHNHFGLSVAPELWWDAATDPKHNRGNAFYTRVKFADCPGDTEPLIRYRTIQRSTWSALPPCKQAEYLRLESLTSEVKADWLSAFKLDRPGEGRDEFFEVIVRRVGELYRDPNVATAAALETLKRDAAEGVRYVETSASGGNFLDQNGVRFDEKRGAQVLRGIANHPSLKEVGIYVRYQAAVSRFRPDAERRLEDAYAFVDRNRDLWVGLTLLGREDNDKGHATRFLETFRKLRRKYSGIRLAIHGGEVDSPGPHVRDTLLLGAERIGHGLNLITDPEMMLLFRTGRFLVEVQLISNRLLEYTPDLTLHPFPEYLRTGIPVCLNTDDAGVWDSNLTDEYFTAVKTFDLNWEEIVRLGRNSLEYSFAEPNLKGRLLEEYRQRVRAFEERHLAADWRAKLADVPVRASGYARRNFGVQ
jgi:adenosine deaminase CECR1